MAGGRIFHRFFYLGLSFGTEKRTGIQNENSPWPPEGSIGIIGLYGSDRFFSDIDRGRDFRSTQTIIGSVLDWFCNEGFEETFSSHPNAYRSAREYRERYILSLLRIEG